MFYLNGTEVSFTNFALFCLAFNYLANEINFANEKAIESALDGFTNKSVSKVPLIAVRGELYILRFDDMTQASWAYKTLEYHATQVLLSTQE